MPLTIEKSYVQFTTRRFISDRCQRHLYLFFHTCVRVYLTLARGNERGGSLTCSTDLSKPATRAEGEEKGEGEAEDEEVETEGLLVVTEVVGVEGVEGAGEGANPRGPPAVAPAAPGAAPALLSTSATENECLH